MFNELRAIGQDEETVDHYMKNTFSPVEVIATTLHHMETNCYVSYSKAYDSNHAPTVEIVRARLNAERNNEKDCIKTPEKYYNMAAIVLEMGYLEVIPHSSEYNQKVYAALTGAATPNILMSYLISWAATYEYRKAQETPKPVKDFVYYGKEGGIATLEMELTSVIPFETAYGQLHIHLFETDTHKFVWMSSGQNWKQSVGSKLKVSFKVKEHSEYRGEKQTKIFYCRIAK
jgi:hypothetical protein